MFLTHASEPPLSPVPRVCNSEFTARSTCSSSLPADSSDHEERARVSVRGSAAALVRPESEERVLQAGWGHAEGRAGRGHPEPQRRAELAAALGASHGAEASTSPTPGPPGAQESPAGVPLRPVPRRPHQHPQRPHRPGQEPGHEEQGGGQCRTHGTNRQEEMRSPRVGEVLMEELSDTWLETKLVQVIPSITVSICPLELRSALLLYSYSILYCISSL